MASAPDLIGRNDTTLHSAELLLLDIHDRAPDWDQRPEGERADFYYEWEAIVDRIEGVVEDDRDGLLTPEQQQRLRQLAQRLTESRDTILRIGLPYPDLGQILASVSMTADERIDHEIASLDRWALKLLSIAEVWASPALEARERQAFRLEWDNVIRRLAKVETLAGRGELRPAAIAELRVVAEELTDLLPTMRRLRLRLPDLDALERARRIEAA